MGVRERPGPSRRLLASLALLFGLCCGPAFPQARPDAPQDTGESRPNILFLLTDDQRADALGCMGDSIIQTPNMDRLARDGVLFLNNFVTTSICVVSRVSILTGQYARRHGIHDFQAPLSQRAFINSFPALLANEGYRTGFVGKWGVGGEPPEEEFDTFEGFAGQGRYFEQNDAEEEHHLTRRLGDKALQFLQSNTPDRPFFLMVSFKAPHVQDANHEEQFPFDRSYSQLYEDVTLPGPGMTDPIYFEKLPAFLRESESRVRWQRRFSTPEQAQFSLKGYYRLITGVDRVIGDLLGELARQGVDGNTVVIFSSDNGFYLGERGLAGKWYMHEPSIRTPLILYDPRLDESLRGRRRGEITLNIDIMPTLLELAGIDVPEDVQGRSLLPLIRRGAAEGWRTEFFYEHLFEHERIAKSEGVRTETLKYIRWIDREPVVEELYDLRDDPEEFDNLADDPSRRSDLESMRAKWRELRETLR